MLRFLTIPLALVILGLTARGQNTCDAPIVFDLSGQSTFTNLSTLVAGNDYIYTGCNNLYGESDSFMAQNEFVGRFVPSSSGTFKIEIDDFSEDIALFVLDGCPDEAPGCESFMVQKHFQAANLHAPLCLIYDFEEGQEYYLIVGTNTENGSDFSISFENVNITGNDICQNAEPIANLTSTNAEFGAGTYCGESSFFLDTRNGAECLDGLPMASLSNSTWYTFTNDSVKNFAITFEDLDCGGGSRGVQLLVWENTRNDCNIHFENFIACKTILESDSEKEMVLNNLASGDYYLLIDGNNNAVCDVTFKLAEKCDVPNDASFDFAKHEFLRTEPNPSPISITQPGKGEFLADGGLIIDKVTGEVDLSSSVPGEIYNITYSIKATSACEAHSHTVSVEILTVDIDLPSAFTPNGDGTNDEFSLKAPFLVNQSSINIFNRWGTLVFSSTDPAFSWDGSFKNNQLPTGIYTFFYQAGLIDGSNYSKTGFLTLIR